MKEQIRSNETMKQLSNSEGNTSEVAVRTPRMVDDLTTSAQNPHTMGGEIFMAEPGQGEIPTEGRQKPARKTKAEGVQKPLEEAQLVPHTPEEKAKIVQTAEMLKKLSQTPEFARQTEELAKKIPEQEAVRRRREESKGVVAYGQLAGEDGSSIFEGVEEIEEPTLAGEMGRLGRELTEAELRYFNERVAQVRAIRGYRNAIERLGSARATINIQAEYNKLYEAVGRGDTSSIDAAPIFARLGAIEAERLKSQARQQIEQRSPERGMLDNILEETEGNEPERIRRFKEELIEFLDPDTQLDPYVLNHIAQYEEAAAKFLDKIISKPLATPRTPYAPPSFYASINLQTFLTEIRKINIERYARYSELQDTTLRFHEMGRTVLYESGNIDAFINITRSMNLGFLQIATQLEGVGWVRRLIDQAHGRLYTKKDLIGEKDYDLEIVNWVSREFRKLADGGVVKSQFLGPDGNPRNLENWEIDRALAFGRNIHPSFYRNSELLSWSKIPHAYPDWLKGIPTESVVKILAGIKWQAHRFRIGVSGGGTEFVTLLYDKLYEPYRDNKLKLKKIGKLEILKDIIPAGVFRGAGFDSGWRALQAYLDSGIMKIKMPDPNSYTSPLVKTALSEFTTEEGVAVGDNVSLGRFLISQEQKAREKFASKVHVAGKSMDEELVELRQSDDPKVDKQMWEIIKPLIETNSQLNLCLGVLIKNYSGEDMMALRENLWKKTADFLPLRIAYMLSEEGVKKLPWYSRDSGVAGEEGNLFSEQFESKLIKAQELRIARQKEDTTREVSLDSLLDEVGMAPREKIFVEALQRFGREKARELAKIIFPHIPFLDDVPFENADYLNLGGSDVFRRRMGDDFKGEYDAHNAFNTLIDNFHQPFSEILKYLKGIVDGIKSPEGGITAQNVVHPIFLSYLELAEQWVWTRWIPFVKTGAGIFNLPTSWLQKKFGRDAISADESSLNQMINQAVGEGIQRREKLPGEKKSQFNQAAEHVMAKPINVLIDQLRTLSVIVAFVMIGGFLSRLTKERE